LNKLFSFLRLSALEKTIFLKAVWLLVSCRIKLHSSDFKTHLSRFKQPEKVPITQSSIEFKRISTLFAAAEKCVVFTTCFSRAMAANRLFRDHGFETQLHIGVNKADADVLKAHAWLTYEDEVVVGHQTDLHTYLEFSSLPDLNN